MSTATSMVKRNLGLDLLRVFLALLIYMFHSNMHFECHYGILEKFVKMGAIAMTGFFMLSGYSLSISSKSVMTDIKSLKTFYFKRFISVFPLYWFAALASIILFDKESWQSLLLLFPFETLGLQSCFSTLTPISHNGGTWFISCLTLCYLVYPFIQWIIQRVSMRQLLLMGGGIICLLFLSPMVQRHFQLASIYDNPFFRILEFSLGMIIAQVNSNSERINSLTFFKSKIILLLVLIVMIVGVSLAYDFINTNGRDYMMMSWISLPCFVLVFLLLGNVEFHGVENPKFLLYCSKLSYAFFLAQMFVWPLSYHVAAKILGIDTNVIRIILSFLICIVISVILHEFIEKLSADYLKKFLLQ